MAPEPEETESSNESKQVLIVTLHKPGAPSTSNLLLNLLNKQIYTHPPLFDSDFFDSFLLCCDGSFYQVSPASVEEVQGVPPVWLDTGSHLSLALSYEVGSRESFDEMTKLWESTLCVAARALQQEVALPLTVLVVAFRDGQENSLVIAADQVSVKPDASEQDGEIFAKRHGYLYAECDTRTGQGVKEAFTCVAEDAHAVARVRFAGNPEGLRLFREQARTSCRQVIRACR